VVKKTDYQLWLLDPVTKRVREIVKEEVERVKDEWADGSYVGDRDAYMRGFVSGLLYFEQLDESFEEVK